MRIEFHVFLHNAETEVLTEISRKLDQILKGEIKIMAGEAELKQAIADAFADIQADFNTQLVVIDTAVQSIIDKIAAAGTPVDLQPEIDQINAARDAAKANLDSVAAQLPQNPTPPQE